MTVIAAIRAVSPVDVSGVDGGVDILAGDGAISVSIVAPNSEPCTGCEAQPVRTFILDGEAGVLQDMVMVPHSGECAVAYCPHGKLRTNIDDPCALCAELNGGAP